MQVITNVFKKRDLFIINEKRGIAFWWGLIDRHKQAHIGKSRETKRRL